MTLRDRMAVSLQQQIDDALREEVLRRLDQCITGARLGEIARAITSTVGVAVIVVPNAAAELCVSAYAIPVTE